MPQLTPVVLVAAIAALLRLVAACGNYNVYALVYMCVCVCVFESISQRNFNEIKGYTLEIFTRTSALTWTHIHTHAYKSCISKVSHC